MSKTIHTTYLSLGCFWEPEDYFSKLSGVIETRVGYSGGTLPHPTYRQLGDHTETVEIKYDSTVISFSDLLNHFWKLHNPTEVQNIQYKSIIFVADKVAREEAKKSLKQISKNYQQSILTEIREIATFYPAEEYHQKYLQKLEQSAKS